MSLYEQSLCKFSNSSAASSINGSLSAITYNYVETAGSNDRMNNLSPHSMTSDGQSFISSNHQTSRSVVGDGQQHQYSKVALDNGNYKYILYSQYKIHDNGYNINRMNIEYNYDYYSSQYNIISSPNVYPTNRYSTNGNYHRNNDMNTNTSTVSKIAKDPNSYSTAKSKVAMANNV